MMTHPPVCKHIVVWWLYFKEDYPLGESARNGYVNLSSHLCHINITTTTITDNDNDDDDYNTKNSNGTTTSSSSSSSNSSSSSSNSNSNSNNNRSRHYSYLQFAAAQNTECPTHKLLFSAVIRLHPFLNPFFSFLIPSLFYSLLLA